MYHTQIYATKREIAKIKKLAKEANETPVIAFSSEDALNGRDASSLAWERAKKFCHEVALKHGLQEIDGYYGLTSEGEFVYE